MSSKFCPSCGRYRITYDYCNFCGYNSLFSRSGLILEKDEKVLFICRILEGHAQVPLKREKTFEAIGANVLRLFTYIGGSISEAPSARTIYLSGEMVVTSKRLIFINDVGLFTSMPVCVFMQPIDSIISVGIGLPRLPLAKKLLLITYKKDETFYTIDAQTDIEPERVKSYIETILRENVRRDENEQ